MNIDYTLYPNAGGILGQTKVQIPDGVTTQWPDGDALVNNFIYKDGKLSGFVDTKALIEMTVRQQFYLMTMLISLWISVQSH